MVEREKDWRERERERDEPAGILGQTLKIHQHNSPPCQPSSSDSSQVGH